MKRAGEREYRVRTYQVLGILAIAAAMVGLAATTGSAAIVTVSAIPFASDSDYDNAASQTTGVFRDFLNGANISRVASSPAPAHVALKIVGGGTNYDIAVYDTTPSSATAKNLFYGTLTLSGDFLTDSSNTQGGGLLTTFTEGVSQYGIAYRISDTGGTDPTNISKIPQTGIPVDLTANVNTAWADNTWYRMVMQVDISGNNITVTGRTYNHTTTSPDSAVGSEITGMMRTYTSTLSTLGLDSQGKGEVGVFGYVGTGSLSITNWSVSGNDGKPVPVAGGPYSVASGGNVALAGTTGTGSYGTIAGANWLWDLDNDGLFDDATGQNPTVSYDYLVNTLGLPTDGVARPIGLKVTNDVSLSSTAAGTLSITPEPATMTLLGLGGLFIGWSRIRGRKSRAS